MPTSIASHSLPRFATKIAVGAAIFTAVGLSSCRAQEANPANELAKREMSAAKTYVIPDPATIKPTRTIVYKTTTDKAGEKVELAMDIFEPADHKASDKTPVVVSFFGGGWVGGSTGSFYPQSAYFVSRGMVAIVPDYRVRNRQKTSPYESVADGKSAVRWLRAHASELGIDPNRIVAAGASAGGSLAAGAGILPGLDEKTEDASVSSVPNALMLYFPVIDTSDKGYGHSRLGDRWKEISPTDHVRLGLPPTIIFHGTADKTVPYQNAVDFAKAMKAAGNRCEFVTVEGAGHGFAYQIGREYGNLALRQSDEFLESLGHLQGAPTLPPATP